MRSVLAHRNGYARRRPRRRRNQVFLAATTQSLGQLRPIAGKALPMRGAKLLSGPLILLLWGLLGYFFISYDFYVYDAEVVGAGYRSPQEVFEASGVDEMSVFYIRPAEVEARLETLYGVKGVDVYCGLPSQVRIALHERKAAFVWKRDEGSWGVDEEGVLLPLSQAPEGVLWVQDYRRQPVEEELGQELVASVLAVEEALPEVSHLIYDPVYGLTFQSPDGYAVRLGQERIGRKAAIWRALQAELVARGIRPVHVDLRFPSNPCYGVSEAQGLAVVE